MSLAFDLHRWTRDWTAACHLDRLERLRGVAVLLPDGAQVALFRLADDRLKAIGNIDPIGRAAVLSRGIVGDRAGFPVVQSPLKKQAFSLIDGRCLDADGVSVPVYGTRIGLDGTVFVANSPQVRFAYLPDPAAGAPTTDVPAAARESIR